jgi:hypothetical protein
LREDCEAFFLHDGYGYLISKPRINGGVTMFRYSLADRSRSILLEQVTQFAVVASVTDASLSEDGQRLAIVTSQGLDLRYVAGSPGAVASVPANFTLFPNDFMEGGTFVDGGFLVSAETRELWRFMDASFRCDTPPNFANSLADRSVLAGSVIRLDPGEPGCPLPAFRWRFNGVLLPGETQPFLLLSNVTTAQAGFYEVEASNRLGAVRSGANLFVHSLPAFTITQDMSGDARTLRINFDAIATYHYALEISDAPAGLNWFSTGALLEATNHGRAFFEWAPRKVPEFYRVGITPSQ